MRRKWRSKETDRQTDSFTVRQLGWLTDGKKEKLKKQRNKETKRTEKDKWRKKRIKEWNKNK